MNLTSTEAERYFRTLRPLVADIVECDLFVLPPFTSIWVARRELGDSNIAWGAQDVHPEEPGPHTGDVAAPMLVDLGCTYVEVGHSERRRDHGESDTLIGAKIRQVLRHGLIPILCVGEVDRGPVEHTIDVVVRQLETSLAGTAAADRGRVVVAYEPVWAIGEGASAADPDHVEAVHAAIHRRFRSPDGARGNVRVIYGGSVDAVSAPSLLVKDDVDGLFVGRAALDPTHFAAIARAAVGSRFKDVTQAQ